jgi:cellulose synthase/poly-beta-1,6-N-acetylglucosamine synthase-like glycosyltransferase
MVTLFWLCLIALFYIYIGYPLLLWVLDRWRTSSFSLRQDFDQIHQQALNSADPHTLPFVSVLIAAYNEESVIEATILNKLESDYPPDRLEILVASDGSTDGTDSRVISLARRLEEENCQTSVKFFRQFWRQGKTSALNFLVTRARGSVLVVSDANSLYRQDAIPRLVSHFADPCVGYVTGRMVYTNPDGSLVGDGCSAYMRYENRLRILESRQGGVVGVDGGIDAMRSTLYVPLRADQLPDFVQPLKVAEKGFVVLFEPQAIVMEAAHEDASSEWSMRVRVALRAMRALQDMRHLLNPWRFRLLSLRLWSHKLLRYLAFIPLLGTLFTAILLSPGSWFFSLMLVLQLAFYSLAVLGYRFEQTLGRSALFGLPYYFTLLNLACLQAFLRFLMSDRVITWEPRKG